MHAHESNDPPTTGAPRPDQVARRDFLRLVTAAALAGTPACARAQREKLRPYARQPAEAVPGNPLSFATAVVESGYATGLLVESREGRPIKAEGNPEHPASLGATSAVHQAALLDFYDPDRARGVTRRGAPSTWSALSNALRARAKEPGTHVLLEPTSSPLVAAQVAKLRAQSPAVDLRWFGPLAPLAEWEGARIALGRVLESRVDLRDARVIASLDSDFLAFGPASLALARAFAEGRTVASPAADMSRLYAVEPSLSVTGMAADHRLAVSARDVLAVAAALAISLSRGGAQLPSDLLAVLAPWGKRVTAHASWVDGLARDLLGNRERSVIVAGSTQPPAVHALVHALNAALGNVGRTVAYADSPIVDAGSDAFDLAPLARALDEDRVRTLVIAGGNPAYAAPRDLDLQQRIGRAEEAFYLGAYADETSRVCAWHAATAHALESWGDARAFEGTVSLLQPLAVPRFDVHTVPDLLARLLGEALVTDHHRLLAYWRAERGDAETAWDGWLEQGRIPGTALPVLASPPPVAHASIGDAIARMGRPDAVPSLELSVRVNPRVRGGERTNNAWLLELPDPVTRQTWGNAALLSRATAARLGVQDGDIVALATPGGAARAPVLVTPGQADDSVSLALGYGRTGDAEEVARGVGTDANAFRTTRDPWFAAGLTLAKTGDHEDLALAQEHSSLEGRDDAVLLHRTLEAYRRDPAFAAEGQRRPLALYAPPPAEGRQWGMVIDLSACTGCAACVLACQAENNIPVVGKAGVAKGRAMHWIRIDRYFVGPDEAPSALLEPMACQHCEKAPCEYVCPVNATTHSADGLNQMIYNRCVGTRFCSNNCPYKVRRFNWFDYHADESPAQAALHNPDVTVRARGVMEKCTYCVQRIREAEIASKVARRPLADGDVTTACEQACPSRAITFGDTADPASRVARLRRSARRFAVLGELGTRPRTLYLARITNPRPEAT